MKNRAILLSLLLVLSAPLLAANGPYYPPPGFGWERKSPEILGFDAGKLVAAVYFAKSQENQVQRDLRRSILSAFAREPYHRIVGPTKERGGPAGLIIKGGYIVAEWGDLERVDMTFSVTKSYLSTVAGLAWDAGLIADLHEPVYKMVWDGIFEGDHNSKITWHHLLNQSSDWSGTLFGMPDWADRPPREGGIDEWKNRKLNPPGTYFKYNDVRVNVLAYSLLQVWRRPLPQILKEKIMDPIGASTTWRWHGYETSWVDIDGLKVQSVSGGGHSGGGLFISTLDHARFGLLFLRNGCWEDRQLISQQWLEKVQQPSEANESYGYMWWLNRGARATRGVPETAFYASGFGGNYIVVDQKNDLVIVTRWLDSAKLPELARLVVDSVQ